MDFYLGYILFVVLWSSIHHARQRLTVQRIQLWSAGRKLIGKQRTM